MPLIFISGGAVSLEKRLKLVWWCRVYDNSWKFKLVYMSHIHYGLITLAMIMITWQHVMLLLCVCSIYDIYSLPSVVIITWFSNTGILLIGLLRTNFNDILIEIHIFSFNKTHLKMSSVKRWPFCVSLIVLRQNIDQTFNALDTLYLAHP